MPFLAFTIGRELMDKTELHDLTYSINPKPQPQHPPSTGHSFAVASQLTARALALAQTFCPHAAGSGHASAQVLASPNHPHHALSIKLALPFLRRGRG